MPRQRGNSIQIDVQVTRNGEKKRYRETIKATMAEAEAHEAQCRADLLAGREPTPYGSLKAGRKATHGVPPTIGGMLDRTWLDEWSKQAQSGTVTSNIKAIKEFFGEDRRCITFEDMDVKDFVADLHKKGLAASTIRQRVSALSKTLKYWHKLSGEPSFKMPDFGEAMPSKPENSRERVLAHDEEKELLDLYRFVYDAEATRVRGNTGQDFCDLWVFLLDTGVRPIEARKMVESDHQGKGKLRLRKEIVKGTEGKKKGRIVFMTKRAQEAWERQCDRNSGCPFAWATKACIRHGWQWGRDKMGMTREKDFVPYMLRHTCATRLYYATRDMKLVKDWMGHATFEMTERYAKLFAFDIAEARDKLEAVRQSTRMEIEMV